MLRIALVEQSLHPGRMLVDMLGEHLNDWIMDGGFHKAHFLLQLVKEMNSLMFRTLTQLTH